MPTSKHRKNHKQKKNARRSELDLRRHRVQVFSQKVSEAIQAHKEQESGLSLTGLTALPAVEINLDNHNII